MKEKLKKYFNHLTSFSFYLFVFFLPWQTKLVIKSAESNFNEISLYLSQILLVIALLLFLLNRVINKKEKINRKIPLTPYFLLAFLFFASLSVYFASDIVLSFHRLSILLLGVSLFFVLQEGFFNSPYTDPILKKTKVIYVFLSSVFAHSVLGIYQFLNQSSFAFKYLGLAAHSPDQLGASVIESASGRWLRSYGGFDHPNIFAGVLVVSIILAAYLLSRKKMIRTRQEIVESLFLFVFYFFSVLALLFTFSRAGFISLALGLLVLFIFSIIKKEKWQTGRLLALFFFSLFLTTLIFFSYKDLFITRIEAGSRLEQKSLNERGDQLLVSKDVLAENYLVGVGLANYNQFISGKDVSQGIKKADWEYQPVHNSFLLIASEAGIFTLIFFLASIISIWYQGRREVFSWALLISFIFIMLFDHWLLSLPFGIIFLFFVLGLI